jgi:hypothetical protein
MNLTTTFIRRGDSTADFRVTLPQWSGLDSINTKCRGKVQSLSFTAPPHKAPDSLRYGMYVETEMDVNRWPFHLKTDKAADNTAPRINEKLDRHFRRAAEHFPMRRNLPLLYYVGDDVEHNDPHFEVYLPPRSRLFTSSEEFFAGLGFSGKPADPGSGQRAPSIAPAAMTRDIGGRQRPVAVNTLCYGFFNSMNDHSVTYRGDKMSKGESLNSVLGAKVPVPPVVQLQLEFDSTNPVLVQTDQAMPATPDDAVLALTELFVESARILNLRHNLMEASVSKTNRNHVVVKNNTVEGAKTTLWLRFDDRTAPVFDVNPRAMMSFPLALPRVVTFEMQAGRQDPLKGRGPVTVVAHGYGDAKSWIHGRGYVTVLGVWDEKKGFYTMDLGLLFHTDQTVLKLEFLDNTFQPIKFTHDVHAHLILNFSRVVG